LQTSSCETSRRKKVLKLSKLYKVNHVELNMNNIVQTTMHKFNDHKKLYVLKVCMPDFVQVPRQHCENRWKSSLLNL